MLDAGRLTLELTCKQGVVAAANIHSTRPLAAQVLRGKSPAQVLQIVPLLFSVCGKAQGAAAAAALQAAGDTESMLPDERAIACEAMQEHLWRLMQDWPRLLGLPVREWRFAAWYGLLRRVGKGEAEMVHFLREFEQEEFGMPAAQWLALTGSEVQAWWRQAGSPVAAVLARLAEIAPHSAGVPQLLPAWRAQEAQQACAGKWSAGFAAHPQWQDAAAETGAWSYYNAAPLLRETAEQHGKVMARVLARLLDIVALADGSAAPRLDAVRVAANEGVVAVRTARGLLLHHVRLEWERVAEYHVVAPTEWNFHPEGAFVQDMQGVATQDAAELKRLAQIVALSLDPCVAYEIKIGSAEDA